MEALRRAVAREVEDLNRLLYHVLRGGVLLAVVFIATGFALGTLDPAGLPSAPLNLSDLGQELATLSPAGFLGLGVLLMILTPVSRVFLSVLAYVDERDRLYVLITVVVFANLLVGMLLGLG